jgi:hypothetical protein
MFRSIQYSDIGWRGWESSAMHKHMHQGSGYLSGQWVWSDCGYIGNRPQFEYLV